MIKLETKSFKNLSNTELYKILQLRSEVFVVEQNCVYQDIDDLDLNSIHIYQTNENKEILSYIRVIPNSENDHYIHIGRVVVNPKYRKKGYGRKIFGEGIEYCKNRWEKSPIKISAQLYLEKFYQEFGFESVGNSYLEDGIPHIEMILN